MNYVYCGAYNLIILYGIVMSPWLASALVRITIAVVEILTSRDKR